MEGEAIFVDIFQFLLHFLLPMILGYIHVRMQKCIIRMTY